MGIGFSIVLLAVGAILVAAGALGLILTMVVFTPRRRRSATSTHTVDGAPPTTATTVTPQRVVDREVRTDVS